MIEKTKRQEPQLQSVEYLIQSLKITVKNDGQPIEGLPQHNIVDVSGKGTKTPCPSTVGYARLLGKEPPRAKARCGIPDDPNPPCWKVWR